jgi:hypothetical protein
VAGEKVIKAAADITAGSVALGTGGLVVGSLGSQGGVQVQGIAETSQSGLALTSAALPVRGAGGVLGELKDLSKKMKDAI